MNNEKRKKIVKLEKRIDAIESFLWAELGYSPVPNTTPTWEEILRVDADGSVDTAVASLVSETVAPAPRATGRAGQGVRELSREEQVAILYPDGAKSRALAQAKDLHDYCNRNGYEGIGHSIGLLVAELERQL